MTRIINPFGYELLAVLGGFLLFMGTVCVATEAGAKGAEAVPSSTADQVFEEAQEAYKAGYESFVEGEFRKASAELQEALRLRPDHIEAAYVLAAVHLELRDYPKALALGRSVLARSPWLTEAHNLLGVALAGSGDYLGAIREFEAVRRDVAYPAPEVAYVNIGKVLADTHNPVKALHQFRLALDLNPRMTRAWVLRGDSERQLGDMDDAGASYAIALEHSSLGHRPEVHFRLASVYSSVGDQACAEEHLASATPSVSAQN